MPNLLKFRWNVAPGSTSLATDEQKPLYKDLINDPSVSTVAGGAAQNTMRGVQWLLQKRGVVNYTGSVGISDPFVAYVITILDNYFILFKYSG